MLELIRFLQKHHFVLLFLLLETLSVILLTRTNTYHRSVATHTTTNFTGGLYAFNANVTAYFNLRKQNLILQQQLARLEEELTAYKIQLPNNNSLPSKEVFEFIPARVVSNTTQFRNNYFIIDKGTKNGVKKDMGVISPQGAAGIIIGVSENYATAMSLLHKYAGISVRLKNSEQIANLEWKGGAYQFGEIVDIPIHLELTEGDSVHTSGHSFVFPENIMVGTVQKYILSEQGTLNSARIRFSTDFNTLRYVFVIRNMDRMELDSLSKIRTDE